MGKTKKIVFGIFGSGFALLLFQNFTAADIPTAAMASTQPQPPAPRFDRDVHLMENMQYTTPVVSAFRTSADARVAVSLQGRKNRLFLFRPEQQTKHVLLDTPGVKLMAPGNGFIFGENLDNSIKKIIGVSDLSSHRTLCESPSAQNKGNPYSCGKNLGDDCYDLTLITFRIYGAGQNSTNKFRLFGMPMTVRVEQPKTKFANIAQVTEGQVVSGIEMDVGINTMFEPIATADGRLLVARFGASDLKWSSSESSDVLDKMNNTEIGYFYGKPGDPQREPCDVRQWTRTYPITHAPYHDRIKQNYGFARYKFRDPTGYVLGDGEKLLATYPWIDKKGKNLMFSTLSNNLYRIVNGQVVTEYPTKCVTGVQCQHPTNQTEIDTFEIGTSLIKSFGIMGLWTHGKMITFDGAINNTEYGLQDGDELQREVNLYASKAGEPIWTRVGMGRVKSGINWEKGAANNTTFVESFENLFNFNDFLKPLRIGDVVWTLHSGRTSEDVVFDDYINPHTLIASDMNGAFTINPEVGRRLTYFNNAGVGIKLQNAATSPASFLRIPPYGEVSGTARIEPVAMGGVRGKGFYISRDTKIEYTVEAQREEFKNWYTGLFVDFRNDLDGQLIAFPDGSSVVALIDGTIQFRRPDGTVDRKVTLSEDLKIRQWVHIGIQRIGNDGLVEFYFDGVLTDRWSSNFFSMGEVKGKLIVGNAQDKRPYLTGWIDELRVIGDDLNPEQKCNMARGTILGRSNAAAVKNTTPLFQEQVRRAAGTYDQGLFYDCYVSHTKKDIDRFSLPKDSVVMRDHLLFPEGPLRFVSRRPDSTTNNFCLSCHLQSKYDSDRPKSLLLFPALSQKTAISMGHDPRRQPMQVSPMMRGYIPVNYFGPGLPEAVKTSPTGAGLLIDKWISNAP